MPLAHLENFIYWCRVTPLLWCVYLTIISGFHTKSLFLYQVKGISRHYFFHINNMNSNYFEHRNLKLRNNIKEFSLQYTLIHQTVLQTQLTLFIQYGHLYEECTSIISLNDIPYSLNWSGVSEFHTLNKMRYGRCAKHTFTCW